MSDTRTRLLDAAEKLFAERGVDGASVRDITELAGANTAAVNYHFGSKQALVTAVVARRAPAMGRRRAELLDSLEAGAMVDLHTVAEAMVLPTAEVAATSEGGRHYVAMMAALGTAMEDTLEAVNLYLDIDRFLTILARATPHLPDDVRLFRFGVAKELVNRVLGQPNGQVRRWIESRAPVSTDEMVAALVDIVVGIFAAEVTSGRRGHRKRRVVA